MAKNINNLKTYMQNKEQNDYIYMKEAPIADELFKQSKFEYDEMLKKLELDKNFELLKIVTNVYEGKTNIHEISKRDDLLRLIGTSENFEALSQALETRFRRVRSEANNSLSFNLASIQCSEEIKELKTLRSNLRQAISIKNNDYDELKKFASREDMVELITSHPEWYPPYGGYERDFVIPLRVVLENALEDRQNLRSDELSIIDVSKKQMTKEALKLKKDLQEIYKTYNLPFSQTSLTDIFSSNPQALALELKNGNVSLETILYEIEKNIQNRPYDTKSITSFLDGKNNYEISSYLRRHASKSQYEYYSACSDYIDGIDTKENAEAYIVANIFKNLSLAKQEIDNGSLNISEMIRLSTRLKSNEFEGDESFSLGKLSDGSTSFKLKGLYFDKYSDGVKMKLEANGIAEVFLIPKEIFIEETKNLLITEFQDEKVKQETLNNCNFVDNAVINDLSLEKKEIEF